MERGAQSAAVRQVPAVVSFAVADAAAALLARPLLQVDAPAREILRNPVARRSSRAAARPGVVGGAVICLAIVPPVILQLASTCDVDRPPAASFREVERGGPARACGRDLRCQEAAAPAGWNSAGSQKHGEKHHASGGRAAGVAPRCAGEGRPGARAMSINPVCPSGDSLS